MHLLPLLPLSGELEAKPKKKVTTVKIVETELYDKIETRVIQGKIHIKCPQTYEGIGVMAGYSGRIIQVARGWPGDRAGLTKGDRIIGWHELEPKNGYMEFEVERNGRRVHMRLVTEQICFRGSPNFSGQQR